MNVFWFFFLRSPTAIVWTRSRIPLVGTYIGRFLGRLLLLPFPGWPLPSPYTWTVPGVKVLVHPSSSCLQRFSPNHIPKVVAQPGFFLPVKGRALYWSLPFDTLERNEAYLFYSLGPPLHLSVGVSWSGRFYSAVVSWWHPGSVSRRSSSSTTQLGFPRGKFLITSAVRVCLTKPPLFFLVGRGSSPTFAPFRKSRFFPLFLFPCHLRFSSLLLQKTSCFSVCLLGGFFFYVPVLPALVFPVLFFQQWSAVETVIRRRLVLSARMIVPALPASTPVLSTFFFSH